MRDIVAELAGRDGTGIPRMVAGPARNTRRPAGDRPAAPRAAARSRPSRCSTRSSATTGPVRRMPADPRLLAARAEALPSLAVAPKEAAEQYRQAIELADNDLIRRSWWFNLADIALRLDDESPATGGDPRRRWPCDHSDEIAAACGLDPAGGRRASCEAARIGQGQLNGPAAIAGRVQRSRPPRVPDSRILSPAEVKERPAMAALSEAPVPTTTDDSEPWNLPALFRRSAADPGDCV